MPRCSLQSVGAIALLVAFVVATPLSADTPAIQTLIGKVPILSPDNEQLERFQFTLETPLPFEVPFWVTFDWSRPDKFGMIVAAGEERTPFWFLSQKKSMVFDITSATAVVAENAAPKCMLQATDDKFTLTYSLTSGKDKDAEVLIDLPSFLRGAVKNGKLQADDSGDWRITVVSASGKSKIIAVFHKSETFPIRQLEMRSTADESVVFAIRHIMINGKRDTEIADFPSAEAFPMDIKLIGSGDRKVEEFHDGVEMVAHTIRSAAAQGALRNPKWRQLPYLVNVDWARAAEANEKVGPRLRQLLNRPITEQSVAREPGLRADSKWRGSRSRPREPGRSCGRVVSGRMAARCGRVSASRTVRP